MQGKIRRMAYYIHVCTESDTSAEMRGRASNLARFPGVARVWAGNLMLTDVNIKLKIGIVEDSATVKLVYNFLIF